jgi:hypothetical protein
MFVKKKMYKEFQWIKHFEDVLNSRNVDVVRNDLYEKLDLLVYLHEIIIQEKVTLKDNEIFLESLILKFYLHGLTIYNISKGYNIKSRYLDNKVLSKNLIIDISSLLTVGRAQMETLLMYQHIYVNDSDEDEQKLRYYSWLYTALIQRLNFQEKKLSPEEIQITKDEIEKLKRKIIDCTTYVNLSTNQQKSILLNGSVKSFKKWDQIFKECNFSKRGFIENLYYILSVYAHSEGLSGIQLKQSKYFLLGESNQNYIWLQLVTSWILTAGMINNLVERFPAIKIYYEKLDEKIKFEIDFLLKVLFDDPLNSN